MKNRSIKLTARQPTWLDRITRLDGSLIIFPETTNGIEPLAQGYTKRIKKDDNSTGSTN
jgi:hypothetical protein